VKKRGKNRAKMAVRGKNFFTEKRRGKEGMELRATTV